jgi:hypothetical protein
MGSEEGQWKVGGARNECCVNSTSEARGHPRAGSRDKRTRGGRGECGRETGDGHSRSRRRWWRCSSRCRYRRRNGGEGTICRRRSHRSAAETRGGGGNFGETLSFDEGRISAQIWAERGGRSGIPWGRIDVVSSFHDGSDLGAHQELEEVVTAVHAGKGGERGTSASRNLPGGRDVGGTEEERVDGEPRARRTVVATRPGGGRGHEGDVALTTRGSSCLNATCAQPRMVESPFPSSQLVLRSGQNATDRKRNFSHNEPNAER